MMVGDGHRLLGLGLPTAGVAFHGAPLTTTRLTLAGLKATIE
jgi:hypothetical protein